MKIIQATNKKTSKVRLFSKIKELAADPEVSHGRDPQKSYGNIFNALSPNTIWNGYNGWKLSYIEIDDQKIVETLGL